MFGSLTDDAADATSVMTVPFAVPAFTFTIRVNVAVVNPNISTLLQTTLPVPPPAGVTQLHPAGAANPARVVFAGITVTNVALSAALGPLFVSTCVYVRLLPAATGFGDALLVTLKSAVETTLAMSVAVSLRKFASPPPATTAVLVKVAGAAGDTMAFTVIDG
jgi:hypothetical protein